MKLRQTDDRDMLLGIAEIPSLFYIFRDMEHDIYHSSIRYIKKHSRQKYCCLYIGAYFDGIFKLAF